MYEYSVVSLLVDLLPNSRVKKGYSLWSMGVPGSLHGAGCRSSTVSVSLVYKPFSREIQVPLTACRYRKAGICLRVFSRWLQAWVTRSFQAVLTVIADAIYQCCIACRRLFQVTSGKSVALLSLPPSSVFMPRETDCWRRQAMTLRYCSRSMQQRRSFTRAPAHGFEIAVTAACGDAVCISMRCACVEDAPLQQ